MAGLGIIDFDSEWGNEVFNMETSFDSYQLAGATETESLMELQTNSPHQLAQDPTMVMPLDSPSHQPEDNIMLEDWTPSQLSQDATLVLQSPCWTQELTTPIQVPQDAGLSSHNWTQEANVGLELIPSDTFEDWNHQSFLEQSDINSMNSLLEPPDDFFAISPEPSESSECSGQGKKRTQKRVGRPRKVEMEPVTVLPVGLNKEALALYKHRRMRDLNNIASQKCRLKRW